MADVFAGTVEPAKTRGAWSDYNARIAEDIVKCGQLQGDIASELMYPASRLAGKNPLVKSFDFRPSELTIWGGENGAGKSALMNQLALSMMSQSQKVCLFSFEMDPKRTLISCMRCAFGRLPTTQDLFPFFDWANDLLYIYRNQGAISAEYCADGVFYAAKMLGCRHIVVDNLMMLTTGNSSDSVMQSQKRVVQTMKEIAIATGAHIHLVAHLRKPANGQGQNAKPSRFDISGSSDISNLADNVALLRRNREKEQQIIDGGFRNDQWDSEPDVLLTVDKQRATGDSSMTPLWYDKPSGQFCISSARYLQDYMPSGMSGIDTTKPHQLDAIQGLKERSKPWEPI